MTDPDFVVSPPSDGEGGTHPLPDVSWWQQVEAKWQAHWRRQRLVEASSGDGGEDPAGDVGESEGAPESSTGANRPTEKETGRDRRRRERKARRKHFYCLDMFPYPSLDGFSVNQLRGVAVTDVIARYQEARGRHVLRPMGWDCFGVGIEEEARQQDVSPQEVVDRGVTLMKEQLDLFGARIDWDREVRTTDPKFYRWTQWLFEQMRERNVAYRDVVPMKWCPQCRMNVANEEVADGRCVHCDHAIGERRIPQWKVRITDYAERLHQGLRHLKWPTRVKSMQRHWIGRVDGHRVLLKVSSEFHQEYGECDVFVRQLELLPAATYLVLAPEHPIVEQFCDELYRDEVLRYRDRVVRLNERERLAAVGAPEGYPTGAFALNPVTLQPMPIWVSKMVLPEFRFGSILGMPGHNDRHAEFASRFKLASKVVISKRSAPPRKRSRDDRSRRQEPAEEWVMINSGPLSGATTQEARRRIRARLDARGGVEAHTSYNLRDWIFARQRFWGEPIPVIHCGECGPVSVPPSDLPVEVPLLDRLPEQPEVISEAVPTEAEAEVVAASTELSGAKAQEPGVAFGETWDLFTEEVAPSSEIEAETPAVSSPLSTVEGFTAATCPQCGGDATRDTDTMPQWAASCWYYLRYLDPDNDEAIFDPEVVREWLPVDLCVGGIEHAILHLLYVRFFAYFVHDLGLTTREEPFRRLFNQGRIYRQVEPTPLRRQITHRGDRVLAGEYLEKFGGDALRLHLLFLAPPANDVPWSSNGLRGTRRFLQRAFEVVVERKEKGRFVSRQVLVEKHRLIRRVTTAIRTFKLNKAVSAFMAFIKTLSQPPLTVEEVDVETLRTFAILLAPFAPHTAAEMWSVLDGSGDVTEQSWPEFSEELLKPVDPLVAIQINDRVRDRMRVEGDPPKSELIPRALERERIQAILQGRSPDRVIVVPGRLINLIVAEE